MILLVGGAGYIGSHTNKALHLKGYPTVVFDNLERGSRELVKWGEFFLGDLADVNALNDCFDRYPIQAVFHFGAYAYVNESSIHPDRYYRNNVCNTVNLLDAMKAHQIKHIIFSSSCATYGIPRRLPIPENHPQNPINPYGRSKLMVEKILEDYDRAFDLQYITLRYFNAAGADPDGEIGEVHHPETHLIPLAIQAAVDKEKPLEIFGTDYPTPDGTCIRDYIHVLDLADAHIRALEYLWKENRSDSFNLGNARGFSIKEVIDMIGRIGGTTPASIEKGRRPGDPPILIGAFAKAKKKLNWQPRFSFESIIEHAWNWHVKRRSGKNPRH